MQSRPNSVELGCPKYFWSEPLQSSQAGRVRGEQKSGKVSLVTSLPSWFKTFFGKVFPTIFSSSRKICIFLCKSYGTVCFQKWVTITLFPSSNQKYFVLLRQQVLQKTWNTGWKSIRSKKIWCSFEIWLKLKCLSGLLGSMLLTRFPWLKLLRWASGHKVLFLPLVHESGTGHV